MRARALMLRSKVRTTTEETGVMSERVAVSPELLEWARQRSGRDFDELARRFPKLNAWERGEQQPTLKQLESFAHATHTPIGFLFLPQPPEEQVPLPDYRTMGDKGFSVPARTSSTLSTSVRSDRTGTGISRC
jgi:transcriptional regulator with XRE-family HTH domain